MSDNVKPLFGAAARTTAVRTAEAPPLASAPASLMPQLIQQPVVSKALMIVTDDQIDKVGERNRTTAAGFSQKMLQSVKASDVEGLGSKLNELVTTAKGLDPNKFKRTGVLGAVKNMFGSVKEKMLSEYQSVESRMDALVAELVKSAKLQSDRVTDLEGMFNLNLQVHQGFEADVAQVQQMKAHLEQQLEQEKGVVNADAFSAQRIADIQARIDRAEKKIDDLNRGMLLCKQLAPQIRVMQQNARSLVQKFGDVQTVTIPAWKNAFTLYIVQLEQKKGAELANAVHDATDEAFRMQADLLRQNTQEIAKANQRSVVSFDVIQHMHTQLLGSIDDMAKIAEEGKKARAEAAPKLVALEQELVAKFLPRN